MTLGKATSVMLLLSNEAVQNTKSVVNIELDKLCICKSLILAHSALSVQGSFLVSNYKSSVTADLGKGYIRHVYNCIWMCKGFAQSVAAKSVAMRCMH